MKQADQATDGGSMPTSGANRPGPLGGASFPAQGGVKPVHLAIERLGINAAIELRIFSGAAPVLPDDPAVAAWYPRSSPLGIPGVVLIGGSSAIADSGPSAFTRLSEVAPDDIALVTGKNGGAFHFAIEQSESLVSLPDFSALLAESTVERLVLLAWEGLFQNAVANGSVHLIAGTRVMITPPAG